MNKMRQNPLYLCHPCGNLQEVLTKWCSKCGCLLDLDDSIGHNRELNIRIEQVTHEFIYTIANQNTKMAKQDIKWNQDNIEKIKDFVINILKQDKIDVGLR
jgi:hypothetical protein